MQDIYDDNIFTLPIFHGAGQAGSTIGSATTDMHEIPKRRRLTNIPKPPETIAVYQDYGAYYVDLYLGTPSQRQTVLVDTGSAGTALPCSDCLDCGESNHTNTNFAEQLSSSFQEFNCSGCFRGICNKSTKTCDMLSHYAEGSSWHGVEVEDIVYPGGFHDVALDSHRTSDDDDDVNAGSNPKNAVKYRFPFKFSCIKSMKGAFKNQQANGIMGLGLKDTSVWQQMYAAGNLKSKQFSMCLRKHPFTQTGKMVRPVGALTFGGVDSRLNSSEMKYVEFKNSDDLYGVHMKDIFVHPGGGETLADLDLSNGIQRLDVSEKTLNAGFMILDSGTTETILPAEIKPALDKMWKQVTGIAFPSSPVDITPEEMRRWPTIIFSMKGYAKEGDQAGSTLIAFPPSHYMLYDFHNKQYLPRMRMHNNFQGSILGSNLMRNHQVHFDIDNNKIGFADSACDYEKLVGGKHIQAINPYSTIADINRVIKRETCSLHPGFCFFMYFFQIITLATFCVLIFRILLGVLAYRQNYREGKDSEKLLSKNSSDETSDDEVYEEFEEGTENI